MSHTHRPVELTRRLDPTPARLLAEAGVPLSLLLDLAAGPRLDSRVILAAEQADAMLAAEIAAIPRVGHDKWREGDMGVA